jgi:hypothetical protein
MAQENQHVRKLIEARDHQIEQRRTIADALAQPYERGETEGVRQAFIIIQSTIEAIERAIEHEEQLETEHELAEPRTTSA